MGDESYKSEVGGQRSEFGNQKPRAQSNAIQSIHSDFGLLAI